MVLKTFKCNKQRKNLFLFSNGTKVHVNYSILIFQVNFKVAIYEKIRLQKLPYSEVYKYVTLYTARYRYYGGNITKVYKSIM